MLQVGDDLGLLAQCLGQRFILEAVLHRGHVFEDTGSSEMLEAIFEQVDLLILASIGVVLHESLHEVTQSRGLADDVLLISLQLVQVGLDGVNLGLDRRHDRDCGHAEEKVQES